MRRKLTHTGIGCLLCVGAVLGLPYPAAADDGPASAVSQYVEMIPTSGGRQSVGRKPSKAQLPPAAKAALRHVSPVAAEQLTEIATSSAYGAPTATPTKLSATHKPSNPNNPPRGTPTSPSSVSTLGVASDDPLIIGLIAILGLSTVAMAAAAAAERRGAVSPLLATQGSSPGNLVLLLRASTRDNSNRRLQKDAKISEERPVAGVLTIEGDALLGHDIASPSHLPEPRDPWPHLHEKSPRSFRAGKELPFRKRSRADQRHVPDENVEELREFVHARTAQESAKPGHPRVALDLPLVRPAVRLGGISLQVRGKCLIVVTHRAQLVATEGLPVASNAPVREKRTLSIEDGDRDCNEEVTITISGTRIRVTTRSIDRFPTSCHSGRFHSRA